MRGLRSQIGTRRFGSVYASNGDFCPDTYTITVQPLGNNMHSTFEKSRNRSRRSKWIVRSNFSRNVLASSTSFQIMGSVIGLLGLIAIGVGVGVGVSKHNSTSTSSASSSTSSGTTDSSTNGTPPQTNPNDPSTFQKDPNLHRSFYGMAYTPAGSQLPTCNNTLEDIIQDIQVHFPSRAIILP